MHQPNFLPWLGFFHKVARSDFFVLLDDVQFGKGQVTNRVRLLISGEPRWLTCPVVTSGRGASSISDVQLDSSRRWREKNVTAIRQSYGRHPYFEEVDGELGPLVSGRQSSLLEYNVSLIAAITQRLGLSDEKFRLGSALGVKSHATQRLVDGTTILGGSVYLTGGGSQGYQDDQLFENAGIAVEYQNFRTRPYPQKGMDNFVAGLSILDCLFNIGWEATTELLKQ
jgi:hypothetical protein